MTSISSPEKGQKGKDTERGWRKDGGSKGRKGNVLIHPLIQGLFIEDLLYARHSAKCWGQVTVTNTNRHYSFLCRAYNVISGNKHDSNNHSSRS